MANTFTMPTSGSGFNLNGLGNMGSAKAGPPIGNAYGYLGASGSGSTAINPTNWIDHSPYGAAVAAQQQSLSSISDLVNQYLNPSNNKADYMSGLNTLNNQTNAVGANNSLKSGIDSIISQYDPNGQFSKDILARYKQAEGNYGQVDLGTNSPDKMTNIGQLYDAARGQFTDYQNLGSQSVAALSNLQGLSGADAQKTAIDNLMNGDYVQGQLKMGSQAVAQQASSSGMLRSGATAQALQAYGQQLAGNTLQQQVTNLTNNASIGNQASQSVANLYNQQNAAEFNRAGALSTLQTAPITTRLQMNEQALGGYATQAQSQGALQSYMNNYMNTYNNAQQNQYSSNQSTLNNYVNNLAQVKSSQGMLNSQLALQQNPIQGLIFNAGHNANMSAAHFA